jgi:hypothetical protein
MATVLNQIQNANQAIQFNISNLADQRELLSQNILSQLRNLVEGVSVLIHQDGNDVEFNYSSITAALSLIGSRGNLNFLDRFHKLIQKSASHYTYDGDNSERLMLKYYEYLLRIKNLMKGTYNFEILSNLDTFPIDLDPSLREYHEKIALRIETNRPNNANNLTRERYYIHKIRPFFHQDRIYYEVTFYRAINKANKAERIIAFTDIDISDNYAAMLTLQKDFIFVLDQTMPVIIIRQWEISIRPCEFNNFARILGIDVNCRTDMAEYRYLMQALTNRSGSLLDFIDMTDTQYSSFKSTGIYKVVTPTLFPILDTVRNLNRLSSNGINVLRYLLLRMNNQIIKSQYYWEGCRLLSGLKLHFGCIPFDQMPLCTSLPGHNPRYWDLIYSIGIIGREYELLARHVGNNVEHNGTLYTPKNDLIDLGDLNHLINRHNYTLYHKHREQRQLILDKGHVFIKGYEDDTVEIVETLQEMTSKGINGYSNAVEKWLAETPRDIDDPVKLNALKNLFSDSSVALIYGAAGTGKSTMVDYIASFFSERNKLFLAHTNPAIDNLKRKVSSKQYAEFKTISSHKYNKNNNIEYDLLVIDECSTVSNSDLLKVLKNTSFKLLVLVGDAFQIESIQFGNWFGIINSFIPNTSVAELNTPFRTQNNALLSFWDKVRKIENDIAECMAENGYSTYLNSTLFDTSNHDEITLCLNYDGLYGINNINRFLQSSNPNQSVVWRDSIYKVGDPILFSDTERFRPIIYNNLKGHIVNINKVAGSIQFDVMLDRSITALDLIGTELNWVADSTVRFSVYDFVTSSDDDDDSLNTIVPFQVAYAVSIHKAQGLEYDSVKIVITDSNEDDISHSIFYTAVTRTRNQLKVFWTPETQQKVLSKMSRNFNARDLSIIKGRRNLAPV